MAVPSAGTVMDTTLSDTLKAFGLEEIQPKLSQLGVEKLDDISYLFDNDLLQAGLSLVEVRKLQACQRKGSATASTEGEQDAADASAMHADKRPSAQKRSRKIVARNTKPVASWVQISEEGDYMDVKPMDRTITTERRSTSCFWTHQNQRRPLRLVFVRHGQSEGNLQRSITTTVPDHMLHLTARGRDEALEAGRRLKALLGDETVRFTVSPYVRTRETLNGIMRSFAAEDVHSVKDDVRIREQEYGNFDHPDIAAMHQEKRKFGAFYYRFPEGESPADLYDRASLFLESMYRCWDDNTALNHVIVCHGMMILVTLMRLLKLPIDEFENLDALENCEFVVLERPFEDAKYQFAFTWAAGREKDFRGMRRKVKQLRPKVQVWDGNPDAPLLANTPLTSKK